MERIATADVEEIDTIITELEISKGKGNLILCVVNSPAYRDRIIQVLEGRFSSEVIHVEKGEQIIQTLRDKRPDGPDILVWIMPEKLTEDLANTLNNFRELFYAAGVPSLIFLSQSFLTGVIREAPDFWRYRGNYYELEGEERGFAFQALETLATPLHYQDKEDLLRRKRIDEYLLEKVTDKMENAKVLNELGTIYYSLGEYHEARHLYEDSLKTFQELGDKSNVANSLAQTALLEETEGNLERALDLIRQAETLFVELGSPAAVQAQKDRERLEKSIQSG